MKEAEKSQAEELVDEEGPIWASEPFRIFFPLGLGATVIGVVIWPLFYWGAWNFPPQLQHPRIMIFGFGGAFLCGFLGTAWPRFVDAGPLRPFEVVLLGISWFASLILILKGQLQAGDFAFGLFALVLLVMLLGRIRKERDLPPPGFALAALSLAMACAAAFLWAFAPLRGGSWLVSFSRLILWQGMLLLPLLGVGSYLFGRFFPPPDQVSPKRISAGVWSAALLIVLSFAIEAAGAARTGAGIRLAGMISWAVLAIPGVWRGKAPSTRGWGLRISLGCIAATFLIRMFWLGPGHALVHLLFLGGFGLTILLVADRVTHGHCGDPAVLSSRSRLWRWIVWLTLLTASTRASADFKASLLVSHHIYGALMWVIVVVLWAWFVARLWSQRNDS